MQFKAQTLNQIAAAIYARMDTDIGWWGFIVLFEFKNIYIYI